MRLFLIAIVLLSAPAAHAVCPEAIPTAGSLQCGDVYTASLDHEQTSIFGQDCDQGLCYGCNAVVANQAGPEVAWTLVCPSPGAVMLRLTELSCDIDIYILEESCDPTEDCVGSSILSRSTDDVVVFDCLLGETYYVLIEAFGVGSPEEIGACTEDDVLYSPDYTITFDADLSEACNEVCDDGIDNDGDGLVDCNDSFCEQDPVCCDLDGDSFFGDQCGGPDCNDADAGIYPGALEIWDNGIDEDCDGVDDQSGDLDVQEYDPIDVCYDCSCSRECGCGSDGEGSAAMALLLLFCLPARRPRQS